MLLTADPKVLQEPRLSSGVFPCWKEHSLVWNPGTGLGGVQEAMRPLRRQEETQQQVQEGTQTISNKRGSIALHYQTSIQDIKVSLWE